MWAPVASASPTMCSPSGRLFPPVGAGASRGSRDTSRVESYSRCSTLPSSSAWRVSWGPAAARDPPARSEEHTSELQSHSDLVCRLLLEKKKKLQNNIQTTRKKKNKTKT